MQTVTPFNDDQLAINRIIQRPNGTLHCELCRKNPECMWRVMDHVGSKEHQRRMANIKYQEDPLADVPYPHREFTELRNGWATCKTAIVPWLKIIGRVKRHGKNPVGCVFQTSRQEPGWLHISSSSLAIWSRNSTSNSGSDDGYIIQVGSTVCQKYAPDRRSKPQNGMFQICYNATTANSECCKAITTANSQN